MRSLWVDPEVQRYPPLQDDIRVDVAIVGGGLSGIGAAYALRDCGLAVVLLEGSTVGSGASGRNAGFLLAGPAMSYDHAVQVLGQDVAESVWRFTTENNALIATIIEDWEIECGFLRRGSMSLATSEEEWGEMQVCLRSLHRSGISAASVSRECLPRPFDRLSFGGLYYAGNGEMDPGRFLLSVCEHLAGTVRIHEHTQVRAIEWDHEWHLRTPTGNVHARQVIIATNAFTLGLIPRLPISPTRGQVLSTLPLDRVLVPFPMYANRGYQYWRQTEEGRLVIGGWRDLDVTGETGIELELHPEIQSTLENFATQIAGERVPIEYRWSGIMGFTPDSLPLVGAVPGRPGMWIAAGYSGHGVSMAFNCGIEAARALLTTSGSPDVPRCFDPRRFNS